MHPIVFQLARKIWPPIRARELGEHLESYVADRVAPAIGFAKGEFKLGAVQSGKNTLVRRIEVRGAEPLYLRAWPWNPVRAPSREHALVGRMFAEAGLATPEITYADDSFATMRRWRLEAAVEREAEGDPFDPARPEHARLSGEIARSLAALHSRARPRWGKPWRTKNELAAPAAYWRGRLAKFAERLTEKTTGLRAEEIKAGLEQLKQALGRIEIRDPVLIHGDLARGHLFISPAGRITWIDFGTAQFGFAEQDLASARDSLCAPRGFERFLAGYTEHLPEGRKIDEGAIETFGLLELWEKLNSRVRKRARRVARLARGESVEAELERLAAEQMRCERLLARLIHEAT